MSEEKRLLTPSDPPVEYDTLEVTWIDEEGNHFKAEDPLATKVVETYYDKDGEVIFRAWWDRTK